MLWKPDAKTCRALSAEDMCRLALSAYYAAARGLDLGERDSDGSPWRAGDDVMPPGQFVNQLEVEFVARLAVHARKRHLEAGAEGCPSLPLLIRQLDPDFYGPEGNGLPDAEKEGNNQYSGRICGI